MAALAAVGVGHGVAGLLDPVASPILAVGSVLIDAAPTPAKEFAVRTFGNYDKPILVGSIGAGADGLRRRTRPDRLAPPTVAMIGISLLGVAGMAAALYRGSPVDAIPSLVAGAVGVLALSILSRPRPAGARLLPQPYATPVCCAAAGPGWPSWPPSAARVAMPSTASAGPVGGPSSTRTAGADVARRAAPRRGPGRGREHASSPRWRSSTGWTSAW